LANNSVQIWQLGIALTLLVGSFFNVYQILREKIIRLEENVKELRTNHKKTEDLIKEMKVTTDKIWERINVISDKNERK